MRVFVPTAAAFAALDSLWSAWALPAENWRSLQSYSMFKGKADLSQAPSLMCSPTPESYLCHCTSPGRWQEHVQGKEGEKTKTTLICKTHRISTDMVHIQLQACFLSLLVLFTRGAQQQQHKVLRIKRAAAFKPPVLVGWEAEPGLAVEQWFPHNEHPPYSTSLYLLQMEGSPISIQMRPNILCLFNNL